LLRGGLHFLATIGVYAQSKIQADEEQKEEAKHLKLAINTIEIPAVRKGCTGSVFCSEDDIRKVLEQSIVMGEGECGPWGSAVTEDSLVAIIFLKDGRKLKLFATQSAGAFLAYPDGKCQLLFATHIE
jgi:hypothetical protein